MKSWNIIGHQHECQLLVRINDHAQQYQQTLLFCGPLGIGKTTIAKKFALTFTLNASWHEAIADIALVEPASPGKEIGVSAVRDAVKRMQQKPRPGHRLCLIIDHAEFLNLSSANMLLKFLEEPSEHVQCILVVDDMGRIPATIISRSMVFRFALVPAEEIASGLEQSFAVRPNDALRFAEMSEGHVAQAIAFATDALSITMMQKYEEIFFESCARSKPSRLALITKEWDAARLHDATERWLSLMRDIMLIKLGSFGSITNKRHREPLDGLAHAASLSEILRWFRKVRNIDSLVRSNVSPATLAEYTILSLPSFITRV